MLIGAIRMPYVFDAYGTLFDVHAAVARHRAAAGPDADRFSELWRQKQLEYTWTHTLAGRYADFWTLTQRALDYCFERFPSVDRALRAELLDAYLQARRISRRAQRAARAEGARRAHRDPVQRLAGDARVGGRGGGAQGRARRGAVGRYGARCTSRGPRSMRWSPRNSRCKPADVMFVSSNRWDVMGATAFGFRTVWINRGKAPDEYADFPPAAVVSDLTGLLSVSG